MRETNIFFKKIIFTLCFILSIVTFNSKIDAQENPSSSLPGLFLAAGINEQTTMFDDPKVIRSRTVKVDFDQLCQLESAINLYGLQDVVNEPLLNLNLFDDVNFSIRIKEVEKTFSGGTSYVGYIENMPWVEVVMVKTEGIISANINTGEHFYQLRYAGDAGGDLHYIKEIRPNSYPSELPPMPIDLGQDNKNVNDNSDASLDTGNYIDVMVLYTATARSAEGGTTAMKNAIDLAVAESNTGYGNSGVSQRLRLVYTAEVSYNETGFNWNTALSRLQQKSDGYMDNIHSWRNTYGADEVALIVNATDYCGMGYLMATLSSSFEAYAFCLVSRDCLTGYYSLAHELGHNMGSHHDRDNASGQQGVYGYSFGYQAPNEAFRTIMAYDCPGGCPRVNYWSNPSKTYGGQAMGVSSTAPLAADNHKSLNNTLSTVRNFRQAKTTSSPKISLNQTQFYFGAIRNGSKTGGQTLRINNSGTGTLSWTLSSNASWLSSSRTSGSGSGVVTLNVNPTSLAAGIYTGAITVSASGASNSPRTVSVTLTVKNSSADQSPFGEFASPTNSSSVKSSVPVTGWVLDDIGVASVKIYNGSTYIGDAVFVEGARPDVAAAYPSYPKNYQAGWGYMLLTYFLPKGGNGTYTLYAKATDSAGHVVTLGSKVIYCNNNAAYKPFGAIDTPAQGGTASGSNYVNFGWALTPQPNMIPTNGSTVEVYIDSQKKGTVKYNQYRADIASAFPGYENTNGAAGSFTINTTNYSNGVHSIFWIATDDGANADGIGSRFFIVQNTGADIHESLSLPFDGPSDGLASSIIESKSPVTVTKGYGKNAVPQTVFPGENGAINVITRELERVVIDFGAGVWPLNSLPVGSTLDREKGIFYWNPGPGFIGSYELTFIDSVENRSQKVNIKILPR